MLQQTTQSGELMLTNDKTVAPFDDIAAVHALYSVFWLSVRDRDVALSLIQNTFLNAWRRPASLRGDGSIACT